MQIGYHLMAWRRHRGLTQAALASKAHVTRPHVSRLEKNQADPTLSLLRRLAVALEISVGQLLEQLPSEKKLSREELDGLARGALHPGTKGAWGRPEVRVLARMLHDRRKALGLYLPQKRTVDRGIQPTARHAAPWLRATLGEKQWKALLRRIDKLAARGGLGL